MGHHVFKLPDVGEGTAEAEITAWHVKVGDAVKEDAPLVDVMTDKATVEITSPVSGKILSLKGAPGDMAVVGSEIVVFEVEGEGNEGQPRFKTAQAAAAPAARFCRTRDSGAPHRAGRSLARAGRKTRRLSRRAPQGPRAGRRAGIRARLRPQRPHRA